MLSVHPNPARSLLHVNGVLCNGTVVKLRNLLGKETARYRYDGTGRMTIDVSALPVGIYLLEAETESGALVGRIAIVQENDDAQRRSPELARYLVPVNSGPKRVAKDCRVSGSLPRYAIITFSVL